MIRLPLFLLALALTAACGASPTDPLTREEAREQSGKSDELDVDLCLEQEWYGDGEVCDDFCLYPDPDCEGNAFCTDDSTCEESQHCNAEELCLLSCDEQGECDEACTGFCVESALQPTTCGGPDEVSCDSGEWCSYAGDPLLARAELSGLCQPLPLLCTTVFAQVCGRDGVTYNNECNANGAGVDAIHDGPCIPEEAPETP